jgi:hypothetical protein
MGGADLSEGMATELRALNVAINDAENGERWIWLSNPPAIRPEPKSLKRLGCAPACSGGNNGGYTEWYPQK